MPHTKVESFPALNPYKKIYLAHETPVYVKSDALFDLIECRKNQNIFFFTQTTARVTATVYCSLKNGRKLLGIACVYDPERLEKLLNAIRSHKDYRKEQIDLYLSVNGNDRAVDKIVKTISKKVQEFEAVHLKGGFINPYKIDRVVFKKMSLAIQNELGLLIGVSTKGIPYLTKLVDVSFENFESFDALEADKETMDKLFQSKNIGGCFVGVTTDHLDTVKATLTKSDEFYELPDPITNKNTNNNSNTDHTNGSEAPMRRKKSNSLSLTLIRDLLQKKKPEAEAPYVVEAPKLG